MSDEIPATETSALEASEPQEPTLIPPVRAARAVDASDVDSMALPAIEFSSNYPRQKRAIFGVSRPPGIYWDSISTAFSMISSHVLVYAICGFISACLAGCCYAGLITLSLSGDRTSPAHWLFIIIPEIVVQYALMFPLFGLIALGVRHAQGNTPQVADFFLPLKAFGRTAFCGLIAAGPLMILTITFRLFDAVFASDLALIASMGLIFLLLNLLVNLGFTGQLLLSGTASIFAGKSPVETAKGVYAQFGTHFLIFGLLFVLSQLISFAGVLLLCAGVVLTIPLFTNVIAIHYVYNFPEDQPATPIA